MYHLDRILCEKGDTVTAGTIVGHRIVQNSLTGGIENAWININLRKIKETTNEKPIGRVWTKCKQAQPRAEIDKDTAKRGVLPHL